jgi:hypothetical protein
MGFGMRAADGRRAGDTAAVDRRQRWKLEGKILVVSFAGSSNVNDLFSDFPPNFCRSPDHLVFVFFDFACFAIF